MEDRSATVLRAARELLEATNHRDSDLYARTAAAEVPQILAAPALVHLGTVEQPTGDVVQRPVDPPPTPTPTPLSLPVPKNGTVNGFRRRPPPTGPPCVFCLLPTHGPGDDAFEFTAVHNPNVKHIACARCIFASMAAANPERYSFAHGLASAYSK